MLLVVRVDRFEEGDRPALHLESLRPFPDRAEDRKAIEQLGLVVRIFRVRGGHLLAVALVTRLLRPRARILVERGDGQEVHVLAIVLRPGFESLLHVRPRRGFVLLRRLIPERVVVGHGRAPVGHRAFGIRFLDLLKLRERSRVPEVVEKCQRAIEAGLHSGGAGRLHVRRSDAFGAVPVLCQHNRGAERCRQDRGHAETQRPRSVSIENRHEASCCGVMLLEIHHDAVPGPAFATSPASSAACPFRRAAAPGASRAASCSRWRTPRGAPPASR